MVLVFDQASFVQSELKEDLYTLRWTARQLPKSDYRKSILTVLDKHLGAAREEGDDRDAGEGDGEMADPYKIDFRRSPNQSGAIDPKFIILHSSYGSWGGDVSWILDPDSNVSYHLLIHPITGDRVQFVNSSRKAWHVGRSEWGGLTGLNSHSIGIAFTGPSSREQEHHEIKSAAFLCKRMMEKHGISRGRILTHAQVAMPRGRKDDCSEETKERVLVELSAIEG